MPALTKNAHKLTSDKYKGLYLFTYLKFVMCAHLNKKGSTCMYWMLHCFFASFLAVGDLERFLDPSYTDQLTLSSDAKMEIILAGNRQ